MAPRFDASPLTKDDESPSAGLAYISPIAGHIIREVVSRALQEDLGWGDVTTDALVPLAQRGHATILSKANGILAGVDIVREVFRQVDDQVIVTIRLPDGSALHEGDVIGDMTGSAASILKGERVALNLLQRLSGIATVTRSYVEAVAHTRAAIVDTRKTTPGLRALEKFAVRLGGGQNHRISTRARSESPARISTPRIASSRIVTRRPARRASSAVALTQ